MKINMRVLPRYSHETSELKLKFSTLHLARTELRPGHGNDWLTLSDAEDGKEMLLDTEKLGINDVAEEVDRHSRMLNRQAELSAN